MRKRGGDFAVRRKSFQGTAEPGSLGIERNIHIVSNLYRKPDSTLSSSHSCPLSLPDIGNFHED